MLFNVNWSWYEDYNINILEHSDKTNEQFEKDCVYAAREVGESYIKNEECWVGVNSWIDIIAEYLIDNLGYTKPVINYWGHFGSYIINYKDPPGDDDKKWKKIVGKKLMDKAVEKNKKIDKKIF